jgi:hypothetical protein
VKPTPQDGSDGCRCVLLDNAPTPDSNSSSAAGSGTTVIEFTANNAWLTAPLEVPIVAVEEYELHEVRFPTRDDRPGCAGWRLPQRARRVLVLQRRRDQRSVVDDFNQAAIAAAGFRARAVSSQIGDVTFGIPAPPPAP